MMRRWASEALLRAYASEGVETYVVTATRGENGRYRGHRGDEHHPGPQKLAEIRESELRAAASVLGIREVTLLDYPDLGLDRANAREAIAQIAHHLRRTRPDVVLTFPPDGAHGHPDHIAICQYATAAVAAAASPSFPDGAEPNASPHLVKKLYYLAWPQSTWNGTRRRSTASFLQLTAFSDGPWRGPTGLSRLPSIHETSGRPSGGRFPVMNHRLTATSD